MQSLNPFVYGRVVTGKEFFGRSKLIKRIQGHIKSGQNIVVFGERRVGKTSLISEAIQQINIPCLRVDLYEIRNEQELIARATRAIERLEKESPFFNRWLAAGKRMRGTLTQSFDSISLSPSVSIGAHFTAPISSIMDLLDYIHDFDANKKGVVAVFDEFQGVLGLENAMSILAAMRSEVQTHDKVPYIFAGSIRRKMHGIFMDHKQPFYKSAIPIEIGPIDFDEIAPIIINLFESGGRAIEQGFLHELYNMLYGNTGDLQQICNALWEVTKPGDPIGNESLRNAFEMVWETEIHEYAAIRKGLTIQQNLVLQTLALVDGKEPFGANFRKVAGNISPGTVQKAIAKLEELDLIFQPYDSKDYRFYEPFFKLWLINQVV